LDRIDGGGDVELPSRWQLRGEDLWGVFPIPSAPFANREQKYGREYEGWQENKKKKKALT